MRNFDPDADKEQRDEMLAEMAANVEGNSDTAKEKEKTSWVWTFLLMIIPFPFGLILMKTMGKKQKWYQHTVVMLFTGVVSLFIVMIFVSIPFMTQLQTAKKIKHNKSLPVIASSEAQYDFFWKDQTIDLEQGSSTTPNYSGVSELDYDKLKQMEADGTASAVFRAQRYQLYLQLSNMFEINIANLYGIHMVETSLSIDQSDMYAQYSKRSEAEMKHSIGPFQISGQNKHLGHAFESQFSTRLGSPKDNSTLVLESRETSNIVKQAALEPSRLSTGPKETVPNIVNGGYSPTAKQVAWETNIEKPGTPAFNYRSIPSGGTSYGPDGTENGDYSKFYKRPNPYYIPDAAYSQAYDLKWFKDTLMESTDNVIATGGANTRFRVGTGDWSSYPGWRDLNWTVAEATRIKNMTSDQFDELTFMYYCDWYLGSLATRGTPMGRAWESLGLFAEKVISDKGSICERRETPEGGWWKHIDGRNHNTDWETSDNSSSVVSKNGFYSVYRAIGNGTGGSRNWEAFTYGMRGLNMAWAPMEEDRRIYELGSKAGASGGPGPQDPYEPGSIVNSNGDDLSMYNSPPLSGYRAAGGRISSPYGMRTHPISGKRKMHNGVDIAIGAGTPIKAAADGKIVYYSVSGSLSSGAGRLCTIEHTNGDQSLYMHMSAFAGFSLGDQVKAGDVIGKVGTSGGSTGNHLHFEIRRDGSSIDPTPVVTGGEYGG